MTSAAEESFREFDFSTNSNWQDHFANLFPTPSHTQLLKVKRKWFKKVIDPSLDVDAGLPTEEPTNTGTSTGPKTASSNDSWDEARNRQSGNQDAQRQEPSGSSSSQSAPPLGGFLGKVAGIIGGPVTKVLDMAHAAALPMKDKFYFLEGILKGVFVISIFLLPAWANMIAFNVCLLGFFRQTGRPRWDVNYGKKALENEFLQNILFMVPFTFFPNQKTLVYFLPLVIHFWIGFCEFVNLRLPSLYTKIAKVADFTRQNRANLMFQKAKIEIMIFVFILILLFVGGSNLILIVFYGNFLKTKYMINPNTKAAFQEINGWVEGKMNSPYCPGVVRMIVDKVRSLCGYLVKA